MRIRNVLTCIFLESVVLLIESYMPKTNHQSKSTLHRLMRMVDTVERKILTFSVDSLDLKDYLMLD